MGLGGLYLKVLPAELRAEQKLAEGSMALRAEHVGQYSPHDGAKRAGFRAGDIVVSFDGRTDLVRETDLLTYTLDRVETSPVPVEVLRDGNKTTLMLPASRQP